MNRAAPSSDDVIVVGAGVGGLCAAARLARQGLRVRVLERAEQPGGKLSAVRVAGRSFDGGPTVLTMRWVFDELFESLGLDFGARLGLRRCEVLARHAWPGGGQLDLFSDPHANEAAIADFAGGDEAQRYRRYAQRAEAIYRTLEGPFLRAPRPMPWTLATQAGWRGLPDLARISPFQTLWDALRLHFHDPRLRQLFARYATYCGSSPFDAPATLMLVSHVEREAVWQVDGGMAALAKALVDAAHHAGVQIDCGCHVAALTLQAGRVNGVRLADGQELSAKRVLFGGDVAALRSGALGEDIQRALTGRNASPSAQRVRERSLSAVTWYVQAQASGFALSHHNVFFSDPADDGYRREFQAIERGQLPEQPTVYLCAQDRRAVARHKAGGTPSPSERLFMLVNAPPRGDLQPHHPEEIDACLRRVKAHLARLGLGLRWDPSDLRCSTPQDWAQRFPATGGALYGRASRGWQASFQRPGSTTRVPGLYLAGGSVHPGPGVPMAALSGQRAAEQILADCRSTHRFHPAAMPGGISMR